MERSFLIFRIKNLRIRYLERRLHCEHCVKAVTEAINKIDGAAAKVNLSENEAVVSYDRELDDEQLRKIVKDAGYRVVSIK